MGFVGDVGGDVQVPLREMVAARQENVVPLSIKLTHVKMPAILFIDFLSRHLCGFYVVRMQEIFEETITAYAKSSSSRYAVADRADRPSVKKSNT
jgi:hypothetical protein